VALRVDRSKARYVAAQAENSTNSDPAWSPDGKQVAHVESYEGAGVYVASFCCSHGSRKRELYFSGS
jgi:Tol biopolymer transport system component